MYMIHRLLVVWGALAAICVAAAQAQDRLPVKIGPRDKSGVKRSEDKTDPQTKIEDAATEQERLRRQFDEFKLKLLRLAQTLENSTKPEDREKAKVLRQAIQKASAEGVETRFSSLIEMLRGGKSSVNTEQLQEILNENDELRKILREIIELLLKDDRDAELKRQIAEARRLLEELKNVIRKQELVLNKTILGRTKNQDLAKSQHNVREQTHDLVNPKSSKGKGKGKGKGDGKGKGKGDGKDSSGQGGQGGQQGQPSEGKSGQQQQQQQQQQPNQAQSQIKKQIEEAEKYQERAEDNLRKDNRKDAPEDEQAALDKLNQAKKALEDLLRQLREEEIERLLARLEARCRRMLALQIGVRDDTVALDKVIQDNPNSAPTRADQQASLQLSDREEEIIKEARAGLALLEAEGSAVAFAEVFSQVKDDMETVAVRLRKTDTGVVTVTIENQIIDTLKEMIEALKKARSDKKSQGGGGGGQGPDRLLDLLAELKMIRSMQKRVNERTEVYGKQYAGEQAPPPEVGSTPEERERYERIQNELKELSKRQLKISKVTHDLATGKNEQK
jgi:DNA repair exonuclease SbcCD ATPase subunit